MESTKKNYDKIGVETREGGREVAKKIWIIVLCALVFSALSFGCGGKAENEKKSKETTKTSAAEESFMQKNAGKYQNIKATIGMPVYMPEYLPAGIEIQRVLKVKAASGNPAYYEVDYSKGLTISGTSNPDFKTDADFIGEFDLGGKHMEEHSHQNDPKSYELLWRSNKATFKLSLNASEGLTRDEAKKIAESMKLVP